MTATEINPVHDSLVKLPQVLSRVPVSRSGWYAGVREGRYPQPVKLGRRSVFWRSSEIDTLIQSLSR